MPALAWWVMQATIIRSQRRDPHQEEALEDAIGRDIKGKLSSLPYLAGILLAFVDSRIADVIYAAVALMWLVPDTRVERAVSRR